MNANFDDEIYFIHSHHVVIDTSISSRPFHSVLMTLGPRLHTAMTY